MLVLVGCGTFTYLYNYAFLWYEALLSQVLILKVFLSSLARMIAKL